MSGTQVRAFETVVVAPRFVARTDVYKALGGERTMTPFGVQIAAESARDDGGARCLGGRQRGGPHGSGRRLDRLRGDGGASLHGDLAVADLAQAVRVRSEPFSAVMAATVCAVVLDDRRHGF